MKFVVKHIKLIYSNILSIFFLSSFYAAPNPFITTWKTDNAGSTGPTEIQITTNPSYGYNYNVDWDNDGTFDEFGLTGDVTHDFGATGTYTIQIEGDFPAIYFNNSGDREKIISIDHWGGYPWQTFENAFYGCTNLEYAATDLPDLSVVTNFNFIFAGCTIFNGNIGNWDVRSVQTMISAFEGASAFNRNLGTWDIRSITDMKNMLNDCGMSTTNYDLTLITWNNTGVNSGINLGSNNLTYCNSNSQRDNLINSYGWSINGDNRVCTPFITTWKTDNAGSTGPTEIQIPTNPSYGYNYNVDWDNDGIFDEFGLTGDVTHDFGATGTYTIQIEGDFPAIYFNNSGDREKIISIDHWGTQSWRTFEEAFYGCTNLTYQALDDPFLSSVSTLLDMFNSCTILDGDFGTWDIQTITDMRRMLDDCGLSTSNYDNTLIGWNSQNVQGGIDLGANNLTFCLAETQRDNLINSYAWNFSGDSKDCTSPSQNFITTWKTDNPGTSSSTEITIPTHPSETYNYDVDWDNDGVFDEFGLTGDVTHDFGAAGTYTIQIQGTFPAIYFNNGGDREKIISIDAWGNIAWTTFESAFYGCNNLGIPATDLPDLSLVSNMSAMFQECITLDGPSNINSWNTSSVTHMGRMFYGASSFNQNIGAWNTSNVTSFSATFRNATSFNQDISNWNTSSALDLGVMFNGASVFNQNIGAWNTSAVTNMSGLFSGAVAFNQNIGTWNTSSATTMEQMFANASNFNQNLGTWNIGNVTNMSNMLNDCGLNQNNYDNTLIGWQAQVVQSGVSLGVNGLTYCASTTQRNDLITSSLWSITGDVSDCNSFITTWTTTNPGTSANNQITIPGTGTNYTIVWKEVGNPGNSGSQLGTNTVTITFPSPGTYQVRISGGSPAFSRIYFNNSGDCRKLIGIEQWGTIAWSDFGSAFYGCSNLNITSIDIPNLSAVTYMANMFSKCSSLNGPTNMGSWNTSAVTNMAYMFGDFFGSGASSFNQNIGSWNTSAVTNMEGMFAYATNFNQNIGAWNTSSVIIMRNMFAGASNFNQNIGAWNTSVCSDMSSMFSGAAAFNQNIGAWNTASCTNMSHMFSSTSAFNQNISAWNTSNVTNMSGLFSQAYAFNQNISTWNTAACTNMYQMFFGANTFNQNIGTWNTSAVTNMGYMFSFATNFNQNIGSWNTSLVVNLSGMFANATNFNQNIGAWNTAACTDMSYMFKDATTFNQNIGVWDTRYVTDMSYMFQSALAFNQAIGSWNTSACTNMRAMFSSTYFNQAIGTWNTSTVTNMAQMFSNALAFNNGGSGTINNWNTQAVTQMNSMFGGASSFNQNIGAWNTAACTNMNNMFYGASVFNQNIGAWNTAACTNMNNMFYGASVFNQNIGSWTLNASVNLTNMLNNCGMSCDNYSATLAGWHAGNPTVTSRSLGAANLKYSSAVLTGARANLVLATGSGGRGWTISGDALYSLNPVLVSSGTSKTLTNTSCNSYIYENPTVLTQKMLNIDVNSNSGFSATNVTINHNNVGALPSGVTSQNGYYQISGYGHTMRISNRLTTIEAPGTYSTNGGVRVRVYYLASEHTAMTGNAVPVGGSITQSGWFKSSYHTAAQVVADMQGGETNLPSAIAITPTSTGTEGGIAYAEFLL